MKKLILLFTILFATATFSQEIFTTEVKMKLTPNLTVDADSVLTKDSNNIISTIGTDQLKAQFNISGLEALDEGSGIGFRLIGRNAALYDNIGLNAIDFSKSTVFGAGKGSSGNYSLSFGENITNRAYAGLSGGYLNNISLTSTYSVALGTDVIIDGALNFGYGENLDITGVNNFSTIINNAITGSYNSVIGTGNTITANQSGVFGENSTITADFGRAIGTNLYSRAFGQTSIGHYNTDHTPISTVVFDPLDRAFNIGVGTSGSPKDGMIILNNGTTTFPELDISEIVDAKSAITKEYLDGFTQVSQKNLSYGESYIDNYRSRVLDDGATYFPNEGGYDYALTREIGIDQDMSLMLTPSAVKVDSLYIVKGGQNFTVDRNSIATYTDENGVIQTAPIDVARINYIDGEPSIKKEFQSTNLITYSEDFTTWTVYSDVSLSGGIESPDLTLSAYKIIAGATNDRHSLRTTYTNTTGLTSTFSIFAKVGEYSHVAISIIHSATSRGSGIIVDLTDGSILDDATAISSSYTYDFIDLGNGWKQVSITVINEGVDYPNSPSFSGYDGTFPVVWNSSTIQPIFTGDGVSGIYTWGAHAGPSLTSYIKTEGATVTRLADVITNAGDVNTFNDSEGVLYLEASALSNDGTNRGISISNGSIANRVFLRYNITSNQISAFISSASTTVATLTHTLTDATAFSKIAVKWKLDDFALWVDGVEVQTDILGNAPIGLNSLDFNDGTGTQRFFGNTKALKIFKRALTDNELYELTKNFIPFFLVGFRRKKKQITEYKQAA